MRKKLFTFLLVIVASMGIIRAEVYQGTCGSNLIWALNTEDSTLVISVTEQLRGNGEMSDFDPQEMAGWRPTCIPWRERRNYIKSVIMNEGVISIGNYAFYGCPNLESIVIPDGVTKIGEWALRGSKLNSISIPGSVSVIGENAFQYCSKLSALTLASGLKIIGECAFDDCVSLTSIELPNTVTKIGKQAFRSCINLQSIVLPNSIDSIGEAAFMDCGLQSVIYPNSLSSMNAHLFNGCEKLESVTLPEGLTHIGNYAFFHCTSLKNIAIPSSVTSIGKGAFSGCTGLTSVTIPSSITSIGESVFYGCSGLTSVTIPNSVTTIEDSAFSGCTGLSSVTIGNSVTSIGYSSFYKVPNIIYNGSATGSPWGARSVNGYIDGYLVYSDALKTSLLACFAAAEGEIIIPDSVTSIGFMAFYDCSGLTSVTIPNSVTSIGYGVFSNCSGLTSVTIPNSVMSIGDEAFYGCTGLTSVTIPNSVTSIGDEAFYGCSGLTSVTNFANTPQEITSSVFDKVDKSTCVLYVPAGSISAYKSANQWKDFSNILPIGAQPADVTTTTVTPSETTADIAWPQVTGAATYTIEIKKNGELICTLTFDAEGHLTSLTFAAPSRNNAPQQAQAAGFLYTVTSLDSGTTYSYTMTAKDNNGNVLKTESGSFTTTGDAQGIEEISSSLQGGDRGRLILRNGQIFILRGEKEYTLTGQEVE